MDIAEEVIARLATASSFGYHHESTSAAEPVALSAIALVGSHEQEAARLLDWLLARQAADGSLGVDEASASPCWPTAWAIVAWRQAQRSGMADRRIESATRRALEWLVGVQGERFASRGTIGHDTTITGWPWVRGTHAWLEPTAMALLALKHSGQETHVRAVDAVKLLHDRMLPEGGCNYGNTIVFGQALRPHVQPTGLALVALAGDRDRTGRTRMSVDYLLGELSARTPAASMCYALLGLAAQGAFPEPARDWLTVAAKRTLARDPASYKLALLSLAWRGDESPLLPPVPAEVLP